MVISTLTLVLLAGLLIVMLRVDIGMHRSADQLERIASALEKPAPVARASDASGAASRAKLDYEEIAAAIAAARVAMNAKKRGGSSAEAASAPTIAPRLASAPLLAEDRKKHEEN